MIVINRCVPSQAVNGSKDFVTKQLNARELSTVVMSDLSQSWKWILASAGAAIVLGFLWLLLMRFFAGVIVWLTILCVYLVFFGITAFLYWLAWKKRQDLSELPKEERLDDDVKNERAVRITSYVFMAIDIILLLLLLWMRRRIALAIGIIKQASKAIGAMPSIIAFPAFINLLVGVLAVYWVLITA